MFRSSLVTRSHGTVDSGLKRCSRLISRDWMCHVTGHMTKTFSASSQLKISLVRGQTTLPSCSAAIASRDCNNRGSSVIRRVIYDKGSVRTHLDIQNSRLFQTFQGYLKNKFKTVYDICTFKRSKSS